MRFEVFVFRAWGFGVEGAGPGRATSIEAVELQHGRRRHHALFPLIWGCRDTAGLVGLGFRVKG